MTEDVVVCSGDAIIVIGPSSIGRMFFSRTNPGSVCHELMGEHVFRVVLENVIRMLLWSREIAGVVTVSWFGVEYLNVSGLNVVPDSLTEIRYREEILDPVAVPFVRCHNIVFQQDNARPHTARVGTTFLQHNVDTLPWPAFSPDMSLIEQL